MVSVNSQLLARAPHSKKSCQRSASDCAGKTLAPGQDCPWNMGVTGLDVAMNDNCCARLGIFERRGIPFARSIATICRFVLRKRRLGAETSSMWEYLRRNLKSDHKTDGAVSPAEVERLEMSVMRVEISPNSPSSSWTERRRWVGSFWRGSSVACGQLRINFLQS